MGGRSMALRCVNGLRPLLGSQRAKLGVSVSNHCSVRSLTYGAGGGGGSKGGKELNRYGWFWNKSKRPQVCFHRGGGGPMAASSSLLMSRSMSMVPSPLRSGTKAIQSLANKALILAGIREPPMRVMEPILTNIGKGILPSETWKTKYPMRHREYTRNLMKRSHLRRRRIGQYRYLRRRLRREVRKLLASKDEEKRKAKQTQEKAEDPFDMSEFAGRAAPTLRALTTKKKWVPLAFYAMPKVPGTRQPLAPDSYDPTAPPVVKRKPRTPGVRHVALIDRSALYKGRPLKSLIRPQIQKAGRNNLGHITVRGRGGGHKHHYRVIDFGRSQHLDMVGKIERIEYDPNRSSFICLVHHRVPEDRELPLANTAQPYSYILCPQGIRIGDEIMASRTEKLDPRPGYSMTLGNMPIGATLHNLELYPTQGGTVVRSAGTEAQLIEKNTETGFGTVRLPSKEMKRFRLTSMATIGSVSNPHHKLEVWGKAGRSRNRGRRPKVRGVAMNPVDHPHGGGEGKTGTGRPSVSKWGKLTKGGFKTRKKHKPSDKLIVQTRREARRR